MSSASASSSVSTTVNINGIEYNFSGWSEQEDNLTNPVCRMGEYLVDPVDENDAEDQCCRVYSNHSFMGSMWEFCHDEAQGKSTYFNLSEDNHLWGKNWYKEISSWKCGAGVTEARFYYDHYGAYDSAGANTWSKVSPQDLYVALEIKTDTDKNSATLFEYPMCTGAFRIVTYMEAVKTSHLKYDDPSKWNWSRGTAKSVALALGDQLEVYVQSATAFESESATMRYDSEDLSASPVMCYNFGLFKDSALGLENFNSLVLSKNKFEICHET